jgi:hypothetical protein
LFAERSREALRVHVSPIGAFQRWHAPVKVEEIHFNHDVTSASSDALNIRKTASGTPIQAPEWNDGQPPQPAAYAVAALGNLVTVRAKFSGGPPNGTARIRAIDAYIPPPDPGGCLGWLFTIIAKILRALFGNVLGDVEDKDVAFDASGNSALETFTLINHDLKSPRVGIRMTDWKWQVRVFRTTRWKWWIRVKRLWETFETTQHRVYVILDVPNGPWQQPAAGNSTQLPWTDALDKACIWALGATTKDEAVAMITRAVNTQSLQSYTPATIFGFASYNLSSYLQQLNGGVPFQLNCTDCADAVTTLANLLGCDLWEGIFFNMVTRKFLSLNGDPAVEADWVSWSWGYHEICWLGSVGQNELIYDGCLQVDMDNDYTDLVHIAQHPIKMRFGMSDPNDYRFRLIQTGSGNLENVPRRRTVG